MQLYRFSPISDAATLQEAIEHVSSNAARLYFGKTGDLPAGDNLIKSLTIFAHYPHEYKTLITLASAMGTPHDENNGPRIKLTKPIRVKTMTIERNGVKEDHFTTIKYLRIRKPDPYRMQVGCADLEGDFYSMDFEYEVLYPNDSRSPRLVERTEYDMLEFFDPDVDVLAYIVSV